MAISFRATDSILPVRQQQDRILPHEILPVNPLRKKPPWPHFLPLVLQRYLRHLSPESQKPNIVLIITIRASDLVSRQPVIKTPNLDKFASKARAEGFVARLLPDASSHDRPLQLPHRRRRYPSAAP